MHSAFQYLSFVLIVCTYVRSESNNVPASNIAKMNSPIMVRLARTRSNQKREEKGNPSFINEEEKENIAVESQNIEIIQTASSARRPSRSEQSSDSAASSGYASFPQEPRSTQPRRASRPRQPSEQTAPSGYSAFQQETRAAPVFNLDLQEAGANYGTIRSSSSGRPASPGRPLSQTRPPTQVSSGGRQGGSRSNAIIPILRDDRTHNYQGEYSFAYESGDGTRRQEFGSQNDGQVVQGGWSFTSPEGIPVEITFVADHRGYQPQGSILPVAPELPYQRSQQFIH